MIIHKCLREESECIDFPKATGVLLTESIAFVLFLSLRHKNMTGKDNYIAP